MVASSRRDHFFVFLTNLLSTIHYSHKCMNLKIDAKLPHFL